MDNTGTKNSEPDKRARHRLTLPGFVDEEIGLGDVISRATEALGVKPCGACEKRAAALNEWMSFSGKRPG
jgi:hypothetical protein